MLNVSLVVARFMSLSVTPRKLAIFLRKKTPEVLTKTTRVFLSRHCVLTMLTDIWSRSFHKAILRHGELTFSPDYIVTDRHRYLITPPPPSSEGGHISQENITPCCQEKCMWQYNLAHVAYNIRLTCYDKFTNNSHCDKIHLKKFYFNTATSTDNKGWKPNPYRIPPLPFALHAAVTGPASVQCWPIVCDSGPVLYRLRVTTPAHYTSWPHQSPCIKVTDTSLKITVTYFLHPCLTFLSH